MLSENAVLDECAATLQQCKLPEKVFPLQTMILFVVNGHNTNPWLGKQGEHSRLILQQCALSNIILLLFRTYPRLPADETGAMHRAAAWGELRPHCP